MAKGFVRVFMLHSTKVYPTSRAFSFPSKNKTPRAQIAGRILSPIWDKQMSTYQDTTESEKKQALLRSPYPHVFAYLQNRIAENEQKLLEATHLKATLHEDCSISGLVLEYHIDRLKVCIARDQKHLFEITVS